MVISKEIEARIRRHFHADTWPVATIARERPRSRAALVAVQGVGEARVRDYADELLAVVASVPPGAEAFAPPVGPDGTASAT